jgi:hypothetical protein
VEPYSEEALRGVCDFWLTAAPVRAAVGPLAHPRACRDYVLPRPLPSCMRCAVTAALRIERAGGGPGPGSSFRLRGSYLQDFGPVVVAPNCTMLASRVGQARSTQRVHDRGQGAVQLDGQITRFASWWPPS